MEDRKTIKQRLWEDAKTMACCSPTWQCSSAPSRPTSGCCWPNMECRSSNMACAVEALLLSKVIVLGLCAARRRAILAITTVHADLIQDVLLLPVGVGHDDRRAFRRRPMAWREWRGAVGSLAKSGIWQIPARMLTWFIAFVPLFAFFEVDRALGEGTLVKMFFAAGGDRTVAGNPSYQSCATEKKKVIPQGAR